METKDKDTVSLLNDLIRINNDRIEGYERAVDDTDDPQLKTLFKNMAEESRKFKNELLPEVIKLEGTPEEGTTASGKVFRVWMDFKAAMAAKNRKSIISSCEYGEDAALDVYKDVLSSDKLPQQYRGMITQQEMSLRQSHDRIKTLRDHVKTI
jgi:uncharacterized protein (TIGR02284 family)